MRIAPLAFPILLFASIHFAQAQTLSNPYNGIPNDVIEYLGKKDAKGMLKVMVKGTAKEDSSGDIDPAAEGFAKLFQSQFDDTGDFLDANLYKEEHFGERYSLLTYILNYNNKPIVARIKMYNSSKGWRAMNVQLQTEFDKFIDEEHGVQSKGKS
jgi:hypothetical protein